MADKPQRIHRPRVQTPEQEAAERALREQFQKEKPSLQDLVERGDVAQVFTMGEYWELRKTFAALKALRERQGLSITDLAERTGMDRAMINFKNLARIPAAEGELLPVGPLNVLIGPNGSGKSSFLQAIDFLRAFFRSSVEVYLQERGWDYRDLPNLRQTGKAIRWEVEA